MTVLRAGGAAAPVTPWQLFAPHRARVMARLLAAAPEPEAERLVLLGSGRCRDVDLARLAARFRHVHLVDWTPEGVEQAHAAQPPPVRARLHVECPVEISGLADRYPRWRQAPPDAAERAACLVAAPAALAARLPRADVVASTCLLSQLSFQLTQALGGPTAAPDPDPPGVEAARETLVAAHLRALVTLTAPGGRALLVSDVYSTPRGGVEARLLTTPARALVPALAAEGVLFRGTSPPLIERLLVEDPFLRAHLEGFEVLEPWLWTRTEDRSYLVYGVELRRSRAPLFP
jgi:hypothetical protein